MLEPSWNQGPRASMTPPSPTAVASVHTTRAETKMSSFWRNCHHWLHWKMSFWFGNLRCSQWWKFHTHDNISVSVQPWCIRKKMGGHQLYCMTHWSQQRVGSGRYKLLLLPSAPNSRRSPASLISPATHIFGECICGPIVTHIVLKVISFVAIMLVVFLNYRLQ